MRAGKTEDLWDAICEFCRHRNWDIYTAMLEVSKQYEDGAKKYNERNWELGQSLHCYIDSGVRHYLKWRRCDTDDHTTELSSGICLALSGRTKTSQS